MRMKMVCDDRTLREVANEFLALKKAQKVRERTLSDYKKYIDKFLEQSQNSLDVDVLKVEILEYFADIPKTSPARFNHPYQYLHALFSWAAKPYGSWRLCRCISWKRCSIISAKTIWCGIPMYWFGASQIGIWV